MFRNLSDGAKGAWCMIIGALLLTSQDAISKWLTTDYHAGEILFYRGFFSFIPYVGMLCGITVGIIIAIIQWGFDFMHIGGIALIFLFGQILESNFLTPKLIGDKIGLHPVWLIFGLFAFGALFGFIGILIAVPLTAICGVIIKHFAIGYKKKFT